MCVMSHFSHVQLFVTPWTADCKAPLSMGFSRQEYWHGLLANKLWKILIWIVIPDHLTCLLRNLYAGKEATSRIRDGTMMWFKIGKGVHQDCILSPCLFNFYICIDTSCDMPHWRNHNLESRLQEVSTLDREIPKIPLLMAESEEEPKSLLMRVKEQSEKAGLKLNHSKKLRSCYLVPSLQGKKMEKRWKQ